MSPRSASSIRRTRIRLAPNDPHLVDGWSHRRTKKEHPSSSKNGEPGAARSAPEDPDHPASTPPRHPSTLRLSFRCAHRTALEASRLVLLGRGAHVFGGRISDRIERRRAPALRAPPGSSFGPTRAAALLAPPRGFAPSAVPCLDSTMRDQAEYHQERRAKARDAGRCIWCGRPARGHALCTKHRRQQRERFAKRKAAGRCPRCGSDDFDGVSWACVECRPSSTPTARPRWSRRGSAGLVAAPTTPTFRPAETAGSATTPHAESAELESDEITAHSSALKMRGRTWSFGEITRVERRDCTGWRRTPCLRHDPRDITESPTTAAPDHAQSGGRPANFAQLRRLHRVRLAAHPLGRPSQ